MSLPPFHLAFPVHDLDAARAFYGGLLGCPEGRSSEQWIDFDFFGHQIVAHLAPGAVARGARTIMSTAMTCRCRISARCWRWPNGSGWRRGCEAAGVDFAMAPTVRFKGQAGEQATMFFRDPSGNALEIKAMRDPANLFARH